MSGITQAFLGEAWIGVPGVGTRIPILKGATWSAPENYESADPNTGNLFEQTFEGGLQYPVISLPVAVTKEWFAAATINTWFNLPRAATGSGSYTNAPYFDVAPLSTIYLWNGSVGQVWAISGAKVNTFQAGYSMGAYVDARLELWGIKMVIYTPSAGLLPTQAAFNSNAAKSQNCSHTLTKNHTRFDITLSNNLILNDECPSDTDRGTAPWSAGTYDYASTFERPKEINSTRFTARVNGTFQAHDALAANFVDGTAFDVNIFAPQAVKTSNGVKITVNNPLWQGLYQGGTQAQRVRRSLSAIPRGQTSGADPITIAAWTPT